MVVHKINLSTYSFNSLQWMLIVILFFQIALAEAGEYVLEEMENVDFYPTEVKEVCADYVKNLNKFDEPMVCGRKIDPSMKAFSKPKWKPIDPNKHPELLDELARFWLYERWNQMKKEDKERKYKSILKTFTEYAAKRQIKLSIANFDLDNDGKEDRILHFLYATERDKCEPDKDFSGPYIGNYMLLEGEKGFRIDKETSRYIFLSSWNVFQYKDATFFDLWGGHPNKKEAEIQVYYPLGSGTVAGIGNHLICRIKFNAK